MNRTALFLLGLGVVGTQTAWGLLPPSGRTEKRPLDLPAGGSRGCADEDHPEIIHFLGGEYEGDGFFFLLDTSGSMAGARIKHLKSELRSALSSLSFRSEFGIVAFADWEQVYFPRPLRASRVHTARASAWVDELEAVGSTRMLGGALRVLMIAHKSRRSHRVIIAVGDGLPTSPTAAETLDGILQANVRHIPWNTLLLGHGESAVEFMSDLATSTRGSFRQVAL